MLFLASLLGIAAVGASTFIGLGAEEDETVESFGDEGEAVDPETGVAPDLVSAALDAVAHEGPADDAAAGPAEGETSDQNTTGPQAEYDPLTARGIDIPDVQQGARIVDGGEGNETITGTDDPEMIGGRGGGDAITGGGGADELRGGPGADALDGGEGDDTLHGEDGDDRLDGAAGDDRLFGHNDEDVLRGGGGDDSLVGSAGNDTLYGGADEDALHGDLDNDRLDGGMGADTLFGGHGDDTVIGIVDDPDSDRIEDTDTGRDYLNGGGGDDTIMAGRGDIVTTGSGSDTVMLGDWLDAGHQAEILDFSVATDMLVVFYGETESAGPDIALKPDSENPASQRLLLDGVEIAHIANAAGLTLDHVALVAKAQMPALAAG
jgi:Ca2+-binding RTX toxin-like protein